MGMIPNSMAWHATIWADAQPKFVQLPLEVKLQFVRDPKIYFYFLKEYGKQLSNTI